MAHVTRLVRIGNSRGVRLPKALLTEAGFQEQVEVVLERGAIVLRPRCVARLGWAEDARACDGAAER